MPRVCGQLVGKPALADPRLAADQDEAAAPCRSLLEPVDEHAELGVATKEGPTRLLTGHLVTCSGARSWKEDTRAIAGPGRCMMGAGVAPASIGVERAQSSTR